MSRIAVQNALTPHDLILHELAHEYFSEHDVQFATLVEWQRLRCGLPVLSDAYDVCQAWIDGLPEGTGVGTTLAIANHLAQALSKLDLPRESVAQVIEQTFWQTDPDAEPDEIMEIALRMAGVSGKTGEPPT